MLVRIMFVLQIEQTNSACLRVSKSTQIKILSVRWSRQPFTVSPASIHTKLHILTLWNLFELFAYTKEFRYGAVVPPIGMFRNSWKNTSHLHRISNPALMNLEVLESKISRFIEIANIKLRQCNYTSFLKCMSLLSDLNWRENSFTFTSTTLASTVIQAILILWWPTIRLCYSSFPSIFHIALFFRQKAYRLWNVEYNM